MPNIYLLQTFFLLLGNYFQSHIMEAITSKCKSRVIDTLLTASPDKIQNVMGTASGAYSGKYVVEDRAYYPDELTIR